MSHKEPGASPRILRKQREKQEKILATAMDLLAERGLEAVTIANLAAALDYTPGALYRYFPSMDALFSRMQRVATHSLEARIRDAVQACPSQGANTAEALRVVAAAFLDPTPKNAREVALIAQMLAAPTFVLEEETAKANMADLGGILILVDGLLRKGEETGELVPGSSQERSIALWAALQGAISLGKLRRLDSSLFDASRIGLGLVDELIRAWQPPQTEHP